MDQNPPKKHHFAPVFYLDRWAGADGKLCAFSRPHGAEVKPRRVTPNGTGYELSLYSTKGAPPDQSEVFETQFFQPLDTQAAEAMQHMHEADQPALEVPSIRDAWTRFILSLLFRHPDSVSEFHEHSERMWDAGLQSLQGRYQDVRRPTDPATFGEYHAQIDPAAPGKLPLRLVEDAINSDRVRFTINHMRWRVLSLDGSKFPLVTSDRPVEISALGNPQAVVALPIGPRRLFLATYTHDAGEAAATRVVQAKPSDIAAAVNKSVVAHASDLYGPKTTATCHSFKNTWHKRHRESFSRKRNGGP